MPGQFEWKLKATLDSKGVTRYRLAKETGLSMDAVRAMYAGTPGRIDFAAIEKIIAALRKITGERILPDDIFYWREN